MKSSSGTQLLTLPFLGQRTYLHGTTLFDALLALTAAQEPLVFKISTIIRSDRIAVRGSGPAERAAATFTWGGPDAGTVGVFPLEPSASLRREAYEENRVTGIAVRDGDGVALRTPSPFSFVATLIPLNKMLLARHAPSRPGQWMFTRLDVARLPAKDEPLVLRLDRLLPSGGLARSEVYASGEPAADLYFSWVSGV